MPGFFRNLMRLVLHPVTGPRRIAEMFLREVVRIHAKEHPKIVCFSSDYVSAKLFINGWYELDELRFLGETVFPRLATRSVCLDVGANIGTHSLYFAQYFKKVIAFEPHPRTYQLLKLNTDSIDNILSLNRGCSSATKRVVATEPVANVGATRIDEGDGNPDGLGRVEFSLESLDDMDLINAGDIVSFIKVDVEGHEFECLQGASGLLNRYQPVVACEILASTITEDGVNPTVQLLRQNNYKYIYELQKRRSGTKKKFRLRLVEDLSLRNHKMVICSQYQLH